MPDKRPDGLVRLNVNINKETAAIITRKRDEEGITATETVRRAISLLVFVSDEIAQGRKIISVTKRGSTVKEMVFPN